MTKTTLARDHSNGVGVTNTELFFDLVYVLAVTELSQSLREHHGWAGVLQAAVLLAMTWNVWVYTAWVTNWLDPDRRPTRIMMMALMAVSLVFSAGITRAFDDRGLWIGVGYALMQIGRTAYAVWALRDRPVLRRNFVRILAWCTAGSAAALAGGLTHGTTRWILFAAAVGIEVLGGAVQFWTPVLGRTPTTEWTVDGGHFAERCQAFILIALGESVVGVGAPLISAEHLDATAIGAMSGAFIGVIALFWLYFDRWAEHAVTSIRGSNDPGRVARAYHFVHPPMVAGIILLAAGEEEVLQPLVLHEHSESSWYVTWLCVGGAALFALGHGAYEWIIASRIPWPHHCVVVVCAISGLLLRHTNPLIVGYVTGAVLVLLAITDRALAQGPVTISDSVDGDVDLSRGRRITARCMAHPRRVGASAHEG